jgi:hypothetical protein
VTDAIGDLDADDSAWRVFFGWRFYYVHDLTIDVDLDNIGPGNGDVLGSDDSAEAWVYGIGAGVTFIDHINARLEYELMDIDQIDDAYTLWLTGAWRF